MSEPVKEEKSGKEEEMPEIDLQELAKEIFKLLKEEARNEKERQGLLAR